MASVDNGVCILESVDRGHHRLYISVWTRHEGEQLYTVTGKVRGGGMTTIRERYLACRTVLLWATCLKDSAVCVVLLEARRYWKKYSLWG